MKIEEIHNNETLRRQQFPVAEKGIFLANAAVCPLPMCVAEAMSEYVIRATQGDQELLFTPALFGEIRKLAAELLVCDSADIALIGPTSISLSLIANGLQFKNGENIIYAPDDYPSNAVVWMNLEKRGVEARPIFPSEPGRITLDDMNTCIDDNTRLVAFSSAHFISGYQVDIDAIGAWLKERNILFSIDGIQTLGAISTPIRNVDFFAADAHKWLLGPCAAGIFYVSPEAREILEPSLLGWSNVICPNYVTPETIKFKNDARRYEAGSANLVGLAGMHAAIQMLLDYGLAEIEKTILSHTRYLRETLKDKGYALASSDPNRLSGITSCRKEDIDMAALHQKLTEANITVSLRQTRDKKFWLRFSPHFFNTRDELDSVLSLL